LLPETTVDGQSSISAVFTIFPLRRRTSETFIEFRVKDTRENVLDLIRKIIPIQVRKKLKNKIRFMIVLRLKKLYLLNYFNILFYFHFILYMHLKSKLKNLKIVFCAANGCILKAT